MALIGKVGKTNGEYFIKFGEEWVSEREIKSLFFNTRCRQLHGKPKLFFIIDPKSQCAENLNIEVKYNQLPHP